MGNKNLMKEAIDIAYQNVLTSNGGPFGAIVVKDGKVIATGCNEVTKQNDPTAHAEIQAIRTAYQVLNSFQLTDCEIYTSCEPCPMCFGAIYWARPKAVYYACTKEEAAQIGFDDHHIYEQLSKKMENRMIKMKQICPENYRLPFTAWKNTTRKTEY